MEKRPDIDIFRFISYALVNLLVDCLNSISRQNHCLAHVNVGVNISWQEGKELRKCQIQQQTFPCLEFVWICQTENVSRNVECKTLTQEQRNFHDAPTFFGLIPV